MLFFFFCLTDKEVIQRGRVIERGEVAVGTQLVQAIPPGLFWRFHITVHHPEYVKFNISLTRDALLGIYGRRNIPPTHTQVNTCKHKVLSQECCTLFHVLYIYNMSVNVLKMNVMNYNQLIPY